MDDTLPFFLYNIVWTQTGSALDATSGPLCFIHTIHLFTYSHYYSIPSAHCKLHANLHIDMEDGSAMCSALHQRVIVVFININDRNRWWKFAFCILPLMGFELTTSRSKCRSFNHCTTWSVGGKVKRKVKFDTKFVPEFLDYGVRNASL